MTIENFRSFQQVGGHFDSKAYSHTLDVEYHCHRMFSYGILDMQQLLFSIHQVKVRTCIGLNAYSRPFDLVIRWSMHYCIGNMRQQFFSICRDVIFQVQVIEFITCAEWIRLILQGHKQDNFLNFGIAESIIDAIFLGGKE